LAITGTGLPPPIPSTGISDRYTVGRLLPIASRTLVRKTRCFPAPLASANFPR